MNEKQKDTYVVACRNMGIAGKAARAAGATPRQVRDAMELDPDFKEQVEDALDLAVDGFEAEAIRRAVDGVEKGVYHQGAMIATETHYSDALLTQVLKARRPALYGDKREITGKGGAPLEFVVRNFDEELA